MTDEHRPPRGGHGGFADLVDWVEAHPETSDGSIDDLTGALDDDTRSAIEWIQDFLATGRSMPLTTPPDPVREELRTAFRRYLRPRVPDQFLETSLTFDSRGFDRAAGMRSTQTRAGARHLILENDELHLMLSIVPVSSATVDVQGRVLWIHDSDGYTELVFTRSNSFERTVRPDHDGHFAVAGLSTATDDLWLSRGQLLMRARLDLEPRS